MLTELSKKIVQKIFPPGSEIIENPFEVPPEDRFWLIPGSNGPRWLVPQEKKYGLAGFQQWRPYKLASCIKWKVLYGAYYTGRLGSIPGVESIGISTESRKARKHFDWDREPNHLPIIYFGTPCKSHKAVAILVDSTKLQPSIICKVPLSGLSANSIKREYNILCYLKHNSPGIAPTPLSLNTESGAAYQEAIIGSPLPRTFSYLHWKFLEKLPISKNTTSVFEQSQRLLSLIARTDGLESKIKILLEQLLKECKDTTLLQQKFVHGDFAPWNIKKIDRDSLIALDWEMGDLNGLPFYDFFYFFLIQSYLFNDNFNSNRIFKFLSKYKTKYPLTQILKFTAASIGLRLAGEGRNRKNLEDFLRSIIK